MGGYMVYIVIAGVFSLIGAYVSNRLKSKFNHYSNVPMDGNLSGAEIAQRMLAHYNISDVKIVRGQGFLTDHYNPLTKTVSLSPPVFDGRSVASAAVAAHECGHAIQHANAYVWLKMRSAIVPAVKVAASAQQILLYFALGALGVTQSPTILIITIIAFAITALFSLVTLPVEFDASNRALAWLDNSGFASSRQYDGAKDALWWAAMTYVVAALSSFAVLLYLITIFLGNRD
ncbi:MAG: zinc metallopeptidase [Bacteroidota bacterium]